MALGLVPSLISYGLVFYFADRIIDDMGGNPEGKLADEVMRRQHLAQSQYMAPAHRGQFQEDIAERYTGGAGGIAEEAAMVRGGTMDLQIAGPESRQLLANVANRMGMSPQDLASKIDPTRRGDTMELSKAAFGRRPKTGGPNG